MLTADQLTDAAGRIALVAAGTPVTGSGRPRRAATPAIVALDLLADGDAYWEAATGQTRHASAAQLAVYDAGHAHAPQERTHRTGGAPIRGWGGGGRLMRVSCACGW